MESFSRPGKKKYLEYLSCLACDNNNFILDFHITPGNIHDTVTFMIYTKKIKQNFKNIIYIAMDASYITLYICKTLIQYNAIQAIPYKRPLTKETFFKKYESVYDKYCDFYIYSNNKILNYPPTNRNEYREYKSNYNECKNYISKTNQRLITMHVLKNYLEEANHLIHKKSVRKIYKIRKQTIERVFADSK